MAEQIVAIANENGGILRFIQISSLGASSTSPSRMRRAKAPAEEAILCEIPEATILKPAVMVGTENIILNPWAHFAKKYIFLPLIGYGSTKLQPVYVADVASAVVASLNDGGNSMGNVYELGGPEIFTMHKLAELMYDMIREWPHYVKVPFPIAKAIATPQELLLKKVLFSLPTPSIFNLDMIEDFTNDTVVSKDSLTSEDLVISPQKLKVYPVQYLIQYHKGGPQYSATVSEKVSTDSYP